MSPSLSVWVIIGSIAILPSMYQSTIFGTSVRPFAPPNAVRASCAGDELERAGGGLLAGFGDPDDDAGAPAAMAAFKAFASPPCCRWRQTYSRRAVGNFQHFVDDRLPILVPAVDEVGHSNLGPIPARRLMSTPTILLAPTSTHPGSH